jgi:renalase
MKQRIAIIGAGISGLTLAENLKDLAEIVVFEKARGVGGRMSTRYAEPFYFDHGTQFFTARSISFQRYLEPMIQEGLVAEWKGKVITFQENGDIKDRLWFEPHYVALPHMNGLCKAIASTIGVSIVVGTEVAPLAERIEGKWCLWDKEGKELGLFDWVISTAPPVQTQRLFEDCLSGEGTLPAARLLGCYTLMIGFHAPWEKSWMAAKVHGKPVEWIAVNSTKPGRNSDVTSLVVHSNNIWAEAHIYQDIKEAEEILRQSFEGITGIDTRKADYFAAHRWRYAIQDTERELEPFMNGSQKLASTGDWCTASRIEDSWLNAVKLARALRRQI